jgi:hypothetical protein
MLRPPNPTFAKLLAEARMIELRGGRPLPTGPRRKGPRPN